MTPLLEQVLDNAEVSEHRFTVSMASQSFCCCRGLADLGRHALGFEDALDVLRGAKMTVFSLVPQVFSPCVSGPHCSGAILSSAYAARRSYVSSLGCFDRARTCGRTGFAFDFRSAC